MEIEGQYQIAASRQVVWDALNDPGVLSQCIPGCESLEKLSDTEFKARIKTKIGPLRASFNSLISLEDMNPPESYTITGEAKSAAAGFGKGSAQVRLTEDTLGTVLHYSAGIKIGGKLAQVGSRMVLAATRKTADDFFGAFSSYLDEHAVRLHDDVPASEASSVSNKWLMGATLLIVLLLTWFLLR